MPSKGKRGRGKGRVAASPAPQPISDEAEKSSVVSDEESSDVSTVSQTTETKKKKIQPGERETIPVEKTLKHCRNFICLSFSRITIVRHLHDLRTTVVRRSYDGRATFARTSCLGRT